MAINAVIFDMDGTLVDSEKVSMMAWQKTVEAMNLDFDQDLIHSFIGRNFESYRATIVERIGGNETYADEILESHTKNFFDLVETELELKPGAVECLTALKKMGLPLAVATSTPRKWAEPRLDRFNLRGKFLTVTCGDEVKASKPAPDIFLEAAKSINADPASCAVIEDSLNGVRSGYAAGMQVFMVPDVIAPTGEIAGMCTAVLHSLNDLPDFIAGML